MINPKLDTLLRENPIYSSEVALAFQLPIEISTEEILGQETFVQTQIKLPFQEYTPIDVYHSQTPFDSRQDSISEVYEGAIKQVLKKTPKGDFSHFNTTYVIQREIPAIPIPHNNGITSSQLFETLELLGYSSPKNIIKFLPWNPQYHHEVSDQFIASFLSDPAFLLTNGGILEKNTPSPEYLFVNRLVHHQELSISYSSDFEIIGIEKKVSIPQVQEENIETTLPKTDLLFDIDPFTKNNYRD